MVFHKLGWEDDLNNIERLTQATEDNSSENNNFPIQFSISTVF